MTGAPRLSPSDAASESERSWTLFGRRTQMCSGPQAVGRRLGKSKKDSPRANIRRGLVCGPEAWKVIGRSTWRASSAVFHGAPSERRAALSCYGPRCYSFLLARPLCKCSDPAVAPQALLCDRDSRVFLLFETAVLQKDALEERDGLSHILLSNVVAVLLDRDDFTHCRLATGEPQESVFFAGRARDTGNTTRGQTALARMMFWETKL